MHPQLENLNRLLNNALEPLHMEIIDESHKHEGHGGFKAGQVTHVHLIITSNAFNGLNRVKRQQLVYKALKDVMEDHLHAVSMELKATE